MMSINEKRKSSPLPSSSLNALGNSACRLDKSLLHSNNSKKLSDCQEVSEIFEDSEIFERFKPKKIYSQLLAESYMRLSGFGAVRDTSLVIKSERVDNCASYLKFASEISPEGVVSEDRKLYQSNFCRDRLCPMCEWRRTRQITSEVFQILEYMKDYKFAYLTLTVRSVDSDHLTETVDRLYKSFYKFKRLKVIQYNVKGFLSRLEITYNNKKKSPSYNTFHPHFHCLIALDKNYGKKGYSYINHQEWLDMWRSAYGDESITQVDIRMIDSSKSAEVLLSDGSVKVIDPVKKAVIEVVKYTLKSGEYLIPGDEKKTDFLVSTFSKALKGRRLFDFSGVFRQKFKELALEDMESEGADLIGTSHKLNQELDWLVSYYFWRNNNYNLEKQYILTAEQRQRERQLE